MNRLALVAALLLAAPASAEPVPALDIQRLAPAASVHSFFTVDTARLLPALRPGFGLTFAYGHRPLQWSSEDLERDGGMVDGMVSMHVNAGFAFADWTELDIQMPFLQLGIIGNLGLADAVEGDVVTSPGDLIIQGRFRPLAEEMGVGVALIPFMTLPTGRPELHQTSGVPTVGIRVAASKHFKYLRLAGHFGYRFKPDFAEVQTFGPDDELQFGVGVGATPLPEILQESYAILRAVKQTLDDNPSIKILRVEGHTDSRGNDQANQELSEARSIAVMRFLVIEGIDPERLAAVGFGEMKPIADNKTAAGRQLNRRVEFQILVQE